jgi:hypothetical protein
MADGDDDVLADILVTVAPSRICARCLAARARLRGKAARLRVGLLAESARFGVRIGICCICAKQRLTLGVADASNRSA